MGDGDRLGGGGKRGNRRGKGRRQGRGKKRKRKTKRTKRTGKTRKDEEDEEDKGPKFAKAIKDFDKIEGLFELYRDPEENKVFLAIRPDQFDQIYLCSITRTQGDGYFFDSASLVSIGRGSGTFPLCLPASRQKGILCPQECVLPS